MSRNPGAELKKHIHGIPSKLIFATEYRLKRDCASAGQGIRYLANSAADCQNVKVIENEFMSVKAIQE